MINKRQTLNFQKTINQAVSLNGIGLHTGCFSNLTIKPAPSNHGIKFKRVDINNSLTVDANIANVFSTNRGTTIGCNDFQIHTVEHLLAAISGLSVDNLLIEIDNDEIPILDGSAKPFVDILLEGEIINLNSYKQELVVDEVLKYTNSKLGVDIHLVPSDQFRITFMMNYEHLSLGAQYSSFYFSEDEFINDIAPSRTFCLLSEVKNLLDHGLIKGGSLDNSIVFRDKKLDEPDKKMIKDVLNIVVDDNSKSELINKTKLRFTDEPVRHKLLDLIGDLYLIGSHIKGHVVAIKSGHFSNIEFVKIINSHLNKGVNHKMTNIDGKITFDIKELLNILPHRYPFLLIDRIVCLESGSRVEAIKNVTINEPYFQGHFSNNPVVPGVLLIESMAQAGGFIVLNSISSPDTKLMYISAVEKTKFKKVVVPGDQMIIEADLVKFKLNTCKIEARIKVEDNIVAESTFLATVVDREG